MRILIREQLLHFECILTVDQSSCTRNMESYFHVRFRAKRNTSKTNKEFYLQAKAKIWP